MKKPEVKTVDFDAEKVETLLSIALQLANSSAHAGIKEATNRLLSKVEQVLEEKLEKVHEEEAKEAATPLPADDPKGGKK